jgi:hypothetical protein
MENRMLTSGSSRRDFLKKTAYVAPLILTLNVSLAQASAGSGPREPEEDCSKDSYDLNRDWSWFDWSWSWFKNR